MEDKSARKESTSSGESGPMYDNPDPSYDKTQGAYVNCATSEASLPTYDNPVQLDRTTCRREFMSTLM